MSDADTARRVLVTGASRGIGRAIACAFAAKGDRVAAHYSSRKEGAQRTLAELPGSGHVTVHGDLTDPDAVTSIVSDTVAALGGIDVVVNNACAIWPHSITEVTYEEWRQAWQQIIGVNLIGASNVAFWAARHMIQQGSGGRIINLGSRGAFRGEPDNPAYGASKAGLHALGQSLAVALAPHEITVASIAPGFVATERTAEKLSGPEGEKIRTQSPFGRVATPEEVAAAVVWLASPAAGWASGTILDFNGASYLRT